MSTPKLVSIGLPVYNGEAYLEAALESLLSQDYSDIELIVSDNGSADRTEEICRMFEERDQRIRYIRHDKNRGAAWNFNHVFEVSSGEYFKWAAHDDVCGPSFVSSCVEGLESDPKTVLAYPRAAEIDAHGKVMQERTWQLHGDSHRVHERFRYQICIDHWCFHIFGVIRRDSLLRTRLIDTYTGSDRVLLAHLSLLGRFCEIPERLFFRRVHPMRSVEVFPDKLARAAWFDPSNRGRVGFPTWRLLREFWLSIHRSRLGVSDQVGCYPQLLRWGRWHWKDMLNDVAGATKHITMTHEL